MGSADSGRPAKRPIAFVALGVALLALSAYLIYDVGQQRSSIAPTPSSYQYRTAQSVNSSVSYLDSSFFGNGPGAANSAYISKLTDTIDSTFHYSFRADEATDLKYSYYVQAEVRSTYAQGGDSQKPATVWSRQFQLLKPTAGVQHGRSVSLNPAVKIPYSSYAQLADQFRAAFGLPTTSEMVVTCTVNVSGTFGGTPFTDIKTATVSAPLDQQVFLLATKYTKADQHSVVPQKSQQLEDVLAKYEAVIAVIFGAAGLAAMVYGFRRQIFKSPYQRELEKIYRYHDGIIIRARHPANLTGKHIVAVESFDDILNIEEEIKAPIIASPMGGNATQFLIVRDDIVYVYTLGEPGKASDDDKPAPPPDKPIPPARQPEIHPDETPSLPQHKRPVVKRRVSG